MKRFWLIAAAAFLIFSSCDEHLSSPYVPSSDDQGGVKGSAPVNVSASQGEKRSITVSWDSVPDAVLYYIYRAGSPLDLFTLCAETPSNYFSFNVSPGSSVYYRVSSVSYNGDESASSNYVLGTSLAQPIISDITDISEDRAAVTWYMENSGAYKNDLLYIVYCFNGETEVAQIMLEALNLSENRAVFSGLNANTRYEYQVEAYLRANQDASEKSDKMDAATARRFRPGPPLHLIASHGTSASEIKLTFTLPDMVDIALGENMYDPKPLYFTISKRLYSDNHSNEYQLVCAYYGTNPANALSKTGGITFSENKYSPGEIITWTDSGASVRRGIEYEYRVQSYVDNTSKIITSDSSRSSTTGWAMSGGDVSYGTTLYNLNNEGTLYNTAELPVSFNFDHKNIPYEYTVKIIVKPLGDGYPLEPSGNFTVERKYNEYNEVKNYSIKMYDLTVKSSSDNLGRGTYSVEITVGIPFEQSPISVFKALGEIDISENTKPIVVNNFHVQDGYKDKFVLIWDNYNNIKYLIQESDNGTSWPADSAGVVINPNPTDEEEAELDTSFSHVVTEQAQGITKYFRIRPARVDDNGDKWGQWVYTAKGSETLGVPVLTVLQEASYSNITPIWTDTQKADTYRIKYRYTADGVNAPYKTAAEKHINELSLDANNNFRFTFRPEGYNDVSKAGNEIQILVEALNKGLQEKTGSGEIFTSSIEDVRTKLVGPANLNASATRAISTQDIYISWNSIPGAGGYYIFRRQFNMNNTAEEGIEAVVYYVPALTASSINVVGKNLTNDLSNTKVDTTTVKATASFAGSHYSLRDIYLPDSEYESAAYNRHTHAYKDQQNDIAQGMSYRYFVVPVIANESLNSIEFTYNKNSSNKHTSISSYSIQENGAKIIYSGAAAIEQDGFTIGFGQNVAATKGTYSSTEGSDGRKVNNGIQITWSAPPRLSAVAGFTPKYTVYRRTTGSSVWTSVVTNIDTPAYIDTPQERGIAFEYAVGITKENDGSIFAPQDSKRFIELCAKQRDEKERPNMLGYMLGMVKMESVSRGESSDINAQLGELVKWYSSGVTGSYGVGNNNWGIDGYELFVMNRNINANWHSIASMTNIPNQINHSMLLTPSNTPSVTITDSLGTTTRNLLIVLRDYKHYFKVRSYVMNGDEKVYCPDPPYTYTNGTASNPHFLENEYVKWGARQITQTEFAQITSLYMARAIEQGNYWTSTWAILARTWRTVNAAANYGGGGNMRHSSNAAVTEWWYEYRNWKTDLQTRAGDWMTFITVDGDIWIVTGASTRPHRYRRANNGYKNNRLVVTGPSDTPHLYSGEVQFGANSADNNANNLRWVDGTVHVIYPSDTAIQTFSLRGQDTAFMFSTDVGGSSSYVNQGNAWR